LAGLVVGVPVPDGVLDEAEPDPLGEPELVGSEEVVPLGAGLLAGVLAAEVRLRVTVGVLLMAEVEVLETGGTTLPPPEWLDTGETTTEEVGTLVRTLLCSPTWDAGLAGTAGPDGSPAWPARSR
jgi:hypothetical protein